MSPDSWAQQLAQQRSLLAAGRLSGAAERQAALLGLRQAIIRQREALLAALHADLHKPQFEGLATELGLAVQEIDLARKRLARWMRPRRCRVSWIFWPSRAAVEPRPKGVVLVLGPWNYPVQLSLIPLVNALAAGNAVTIKPSEWTPQVNQVLARVIAEAFPDGLVQWIEGDSNDGQDLVQLDFDHIFFTGHHGNGRKVAAAAAPRLIPTTLELSGKGPCVIAPDAINSTVARRVAWGKWLNAGQSCIAPDYLLVPQQDEAKFIELLQSAVHEFFGDDPQQSPAYGRMIHGDQLQRQQGYLQHGTIKFGGKVDESDLYFEPTILTNLSPESPPMREEIFGPVLPVVSYRDDDDLRAQLGNTGHALATMIFANDTQWARAVCAQMITGSLYINDTMVPLGNPHLPFGGSGTSGWGRYHGQAGFDTFSHLVSTYQARLWPDWRRRYPPYDAAERWLKRWWVSE